MPRCEYVLAGSEGIESLLKAGSPGRSRHRAEQWRVFIEHHLYWDLREECAELFFFTKRPKKSAVFHFLANLYGDAPCDPDAAASQGLQCKVPGFRAIQIGPEIKRLHANRALSFQSQARDFRGSIVFKAVEAIVPHGCVKKFVQREESASG